MAAAEAAAATGTESRFTRAEVEYLSAPLRLGRLATVGADGTPHVVPVGFFHEATRDVIEVTGRELAKTKKFRDVERSGRAAIVVDDLASVDPWLPRGIEIRGRAEAIRYPMPRIRIHPERIVSWGLEGRRNARSV
ncbi:MAG TPA: PPOX class F420-dependent oxidoreductase [Solirubrobacterales bacterium]|nr:PPOX class F420-dependent oxidoreductase [Solirubrobacterales bacterium]